ncbi:MAG: hypothetical protein HXX13_12865 [Bacteroidetes bacterium]|nr:hypothetical protein [Bacteroidota bacterium]
MKKIALISIIALVAFQGYSQNMYDVLRYSNTSYNGTARFNGLSGAYGAIGADFSSLSQNPAGIALYRKSEFTISPGFYSALSKSDYYSNKSSDNKNNLVMGNLGMVFNLNLNENNDASILKGLQFGFGMNRSNSFSRNILVQGYNTKSSLLGSYADEANNGGSPLSVDGLDSYSTYLAYDANLMVFDSTSSSNPWWVDMPNGKVQQSKSIEMTGSSREMVVSGGANFENKLYMGLSLCFPSIRYDETSTYVEEDINGLSPKTDPAFNFKSMTRHDQLKTRGNGFNLKFGVIYQPFDFLRLGGAFHSRTTYNLSDDYSSDITGLFENGSEFKSKSPLGAFDYQITTPMRAMGSIALLFGRVGLLSADYEFVDYTSAKITSSDDPFFDVNDSIQSHLQSASNIRVGAEIKSGPFAFRAGVNSYGSPYKNETTLGARKGYSLGFGIREKEYSLDFSYNHMFMKDNMSLYNMASAVSKNEYSSNQFEVTLGLRF